MRAFVLAILIALSSAASAADVKVMAAGSLKAPFSAIFGDYAKQYGGSFSPVWGPSGVLRERLQKGEAFDLFASASLQHAQALTNAGISGPSVVFARNTLCVVAAADRALDSGHLVDTMLQPDIRIGTSTPVSDPAGDYTWEMFREIDAARPGAFDTLSKKAQQVFGGPTTSAPVNGHPPLVAALDDHRIDLAVTYCSGAEQLAHDFPAYKSVRLPLELSVGPEYGLTVSRKASAGAADVAMYLLSPPAQARLNSFGFIPVALPASR
ncbi:substrate-binding domain-containing protein [Bradyrhizobium sp.]|uniref:substrate-binding domain-containing protein n=1 Tax=Bradyrhizobium sp. TaxID=376 RepID=UPI003C32ABB1